MSHKLVFLIGSYIFKWEITFDRIKLINLYFEKRTWKSLFESAYLCACPSSPIRQGDRDWLTVPPYIFFLSYKNGIFRREQSPRYCLSNVSLQLYKALWLSSSCQNVRRNGAHPLKGGATPCFLHPAASVRTRWWGTQVHAEKFSFSGTAQQWERSPNWNTPGSLWQT